MEKETTTLNIRKDIKERAVEAIRKGTFPGINSLSSLVELALDRILKETASVQVVEVAAK